MIRPSGRSDRLLAPLLRSRLTTSESLRKAMIETWLPANLAKAGFESLVPPQRPRASLTYAYNHVVLRDEPWVTHVEWAHVLSGRNTRIFAKVRPLIESVLASPNCKAVLTWSEIARQSLLLNYDCSSFAAKIRLLPLAVPPKRFEADREGGPFRMLFLDSADADNGLAFYRKGGPYALEAFALLAKRYPQIQMVVRAFVPGEVRSAFASLPNPRIVDRILSWAELQSIFTTAHVLLAPTHDTPYGSILDAMSYGLPVVTTDSMANAELVEDGVTGFVVAR